MAKPRLHIHVSASARDCDGGHARDYTFSEFDGKSGREAWTAWVAHIIQFSGSSFGEVGGSLERWTDEDGDWHLRTFTPTDEGWSEEHAYTCTARCPDGAGPVWDQFAEAAGY